MTIFPFTEIPNVLFQDNMKCKPGVGGCLMITMTVPRECIWLKSAINCTPFPNPIKDLKTLINSDVCPYSARPYLAQGQQGEAHSLAKEWEKPEKAKHTSKTHNGDTSLGSTVSVFRDP